MHDEWSYDTQADFDAKEIRLYDTDVIFDEDFYATWIKDLPYLRWYGPFNHEGRQGPLFRTVSDKGEKYGFSLIIEMDNQDIFMSYLNKEEKLCGDEQEFFSEESPEDDPYLQIKDQKFDFTNPQQAITVQGAIVATF